MKRYLFLFSSVVAFCLCACDNSVPDYGADEAPVFRIVKDTLRLSVGEASHLSLSVPLSEVEWASSADSVASVDWRGVVTAKSEGAAVVTASRLSVHTGLNQAPASLFTDSCFVFVRGE